MAEVIADLSARWDLAGLQPTRGGTFNELHSKLDFFRRHYGEYLPCLGPDSLDYEARLELWLENTKDEAQKRVLLELAAEIHFFTRDDFLKLYQSALTGPICKWLIEQVSLDIADPNLAQKIAVEVNDHTWFCAMTDSMAIADFYHANKLTGTQHRPDCRSLARFGDPDEIARYMKTRRTGAGVKPLTRIVVLEDFVGSGVQLNEAERSFSTPTGKVDLTVLDFLATLPNSPPVLFVPLVTCPVGLAIAENVAAKHAHMRVEPLMTLAPSDFVTSKSSHSPQSFELLLQGLANNTWAQVQGDNASFPRPYTPFGFMDTGARVVLFSNTPANTISLIHHTSNTWEPLFARAARVR